MLSDAKGFTKIYLATGKTDLRRGVDGLASIIESEFQINPFEKDVLFIFCGTRLDRIKCLVWEGDGFLLMYKRLQDGKFKWPRTEREAMNVTQEQFEWLMKGLSVVPGVREVHPRSVY
jgi:transposase